MNILGLISQLIGIKTLRLTLFSLHKSPEPPLSLTCTPSNPSLLYFLIFFSSSSSPFFTLPILSLFYSSHLLHFFTLFPFFVSLPVFPLSLKHKLIIFLIRSNPNPPHRPLSHIEDPFPPSHRIASLVLLEGFTDHPNLPHRVEDLVAAGGPISLQVWKSKAHWLYSADDLGVMVLC